MKKILHITLIAFLLFPVLSQAKTAKDKHSKSKTISKTFSVAPNATVKVSNSYGNLDVITWDENRVVFEITITTSGNDQDKVEKKLQAIDVKFSGASNYVSAQTIFNKNNSNSWWNWSNNNKVNMKVNYVIKMPATNNVHLNNDYGNINLGKLEGDATINCDYGKITTKELMSANNVFNFDYTKGCYFEYINDGKINADYSDFVISKVKHIAVNADYTKSTIETAESVTYNCDYGNMTIIKVNTVNGNGDYLTTHIGDVYKNVTIKADFGSIKIDRMTQNAKDLHIESDYVNLKIGYAPNYSFNFNLDLEYANLKANNDLNYTKKIIDYGDKHYIGYRGDKATANKITVKSDYGNLTLFEN
ncbi:hypothetical protein PK35_08760 [Tamlana nanhaiensis]|uniref:Adhesin domain-containing protein n=1 Tax=Neotamlana nanhaiensis TaxID=1382798 RepID=A0A0D7W5D9_9FLAO|nr:hypothetical protein [Tamlana nanhaiensis]KJD33047.1 hypothetical protein PK35_08760 [Tamlana nanhaiensis]